MMVWWFDDGIVVIQWCGVGDSCNEYGGDGCANCGCFNSLGGVCGSYITKELLRLF